MTAIVADISEWMNFVTSPDPTVEVNKQTSRSTKYDKIHEKIEHGVRKKWLVESVFDDLPINNTISPSFLRLSEKDLMEPSSTCVQSIADALHDDEFFVISVESDSMLAIEEVYENAAKFFKLPQQTKQQMKEYHFMGRESGYTRLYFDNTDSKRDPEERDLVEVRYADISKLEWADKDFKHSATELYQRLFQLSTHVLAKAADGISIPRRDLFYLLGEDTDKINTLSPTTNGASNMCMFRYQDEKKRYTEMQKCMVHRDSGLITLLPRSTFPGLHILSQDRTNWISIEHFTKPNDVLVFSGQTLEVLTGGYFKAAVHRVVREPEEERYSIPFELKPENDTYLTSFVSRSEILSQFAAKEPYEPIVINPHEPVFHSAICDHCNAYIVGIRWKCRHCEDYDLCENCYRIHDQQVKSAHGLSFLKNKKANKPIHNQVHSFCMLSKRVPFYVRLKEFLDNTENDAEVMKLVKHASIDLKNMYTFDFMEDMMMNRRLRKRWRLRQVQKELFNEQ